jgi:hypothetical protein
MKRIRGLSNDQYRERKEAISRTLRALYEGYAADPIPPDWLDRLDRAARHDA